MIKVQNLSLDYGLFDVSCQIPQGKLTGIIGANGAGKSTLLKSIAGIIRPTSGDIWLENCKIDNFSALHRSQKISYLVQNPTVAWQLSVYDVIALGLPNAVKKQEEVAKIREIAEKLSITELLNKSYQQLSGGEKSRVQLARCCIKQAPILLADEPIATLDPYYQIEIMQQLKALTPKQTCAVVLHHLDLAYRFCDEVILLKDGKIIASGGTQAVLNVENLAKAFEIKAKIDMEKREIWGIKQL